MTCLGIDVQVKRGFSCAAIDAQGVLVVSDWYSTPRQVLGWVSELASRSADGVVVGIDAPSHARVSPRSWYWEGSDYFEDRALHTVNGPS